jgi:hypothetical protein
MYLIMKISSRHINRSLRAFRSNDVTVRGTHFLADAKASNEIDRMYDQWDDTNVSANEVITESAQIYTERTNRITKRLLLGWPVSVMAALLAGDQTRRGLDAIAGKGTLSAIGAFAIGIAADVAVSVPFTKGIVREAKIADAALSVFMDQTNDEKVPHCDLSTMPGIDGIIANQINIVNDFGPVDLPTITETLAQAASKASDEGDDLLAAGVQKTLVRYNKLAHSDLNPHSSY